VRAGWSLWRGGLLYPNPSFDLTASSPSMNCECYGARPGWSMASWRTSAKRARDKPTIRLLKGGNRVPCSIPIRSLRSVTSPSSAWRNGLCLP
jgi:hypothetical protein